MSTLKADLHGLCRLALWAGVILFAAVTPTVTLACTLTASPVVPGFYAPDDREAFEIGLRLTASGDPSTCEDSEVVVAALSGRSTLDGDGGALRVSVTEESSFAGSPKHLVLSSRAVEELARDGMLEASLAIIGPSQFVWPGLYAADYVVRVDGGTVDSTTIAVEVAPAVRLAVGQPARVGLSFGEAEPGKRVSTDVLYQTNVPVSASLVSVNGGMLLDAENLAGGGIPYIATINETVVATDGLSGVTLAPRPGSNGLGGANVRFTLKPGQPVFAGKYRDQVTLRIIAF